MKNNIKHHIKKTVTSINWLNFVFLFLSFSYSIYLLLLFGAIAQGYISSFGIYSCENCFTEVEDFTKIISNKPDIYYLVMSMIIFIFSLAFKQRIKILITTWLAAAFTITAFDVALAKENISLIPYAIENLMFNSFGGFFLSLFILLNLASINYLLKNTKTSIGVATIIPLSSAFLLSFMIYGFLYLIYERSPVHIDALFNDKLLGSIHTADDESFGFLTASKTINDEISIQSYLNNNFTWKSGDQNYDVEAYLFSDCILNSTSLDKYKQKPIKLIDVKTLEFSSDRPVIYFIKGEKLSTSIQNSKEVNYSNKDKIISQIEDGSAKFKSTYLPFTLMVNIAPFDEKSFLKKTDYKLTINKQENLITNTVRQYNIIHQKELKCRQIIPSDNRIPTENNITGVASIAFRFIPKGHLTLSNDPLLTINIKNGDFTKRKDSKAPLSDISNGYLKHINLIGLEELKVNNKKIDVSDSDLLYATGNNLVGFVTKNNKIKIFGTAEKLALNTKIMNLKPISTLNSKLSYFNTSLIDILKVIFGMGVIIFISNYLIKFIKRKEEITVLRK
ncbi:hypothetical protein POV97_14900 [Enterobacter cloacae]|uniref:hypothetical protein n=1 Tax=Enterobacter cloacae TaxID=550 RepID=UPI0028DE10FD|nr:hypothetical protein [Enterobacter cloacae]